MARVLELVLLSLRARASYPTRVWTALLLPVLAGTAFGWSTRMKLEGLILGVLVAAFYTLFQFVWKKYLK
jgi:hypothetical protein